jgi:hypothetical protein
MCTPQDFTPARVDSTTNQFGTKIIQGMDSYISVRNNADTVLKLMLTPVGNSAIPIIPRGIL